MREHFPVAQRRVAGTGVRAYMLYIFTKLTPALLQEAHLDGTTLGPF